MFADRAQQVAVTRRTVPQFVLGARRPRGETLRENRFWCGRVDRRTGAVKAHAVEDILIAGPGKDLARMLEILGSGRMMPPQLQPLGQPVGDRGGRNIVPPEVAVG